jgi:hypothetical protein
MPTGSARQRIGLRRGVLPLLLCALPLSLCAPDRANAQPAHGVYAELFGKGGLWGLGYDYRLHHRLTVGAVASAYSLNGKRVITLSPYLGVYLRKGGAHGWFADAGPQAVHTWAPSPIPEWEGHSSSGLGVLVATGYEYRARLLVRVFAEGVAGKGGVLPWLGAGVGCAF